MYDVDNSKKIYEIWYMIYDDYDVNVLTVWRGIATDLLYNALFSYSVKVAPKCIFALYTPIPPLQNKTLCSDNFLLFFLRVFTSIYFNLIHFNLQ